jgi:hypothetical protein
VSAAGNGAVIIMQPDAPISLAEVVASRTVSTLGLTWAPGALDGGSNVLDY